MARVTVTAFTAARALEIEQSAIISGTIRGDNLVLNTRGGNEITAGNVRGAKGEKGEPGGVWDATAARTGAVKLAGNLGGTAEIPTVTGNLNSTVEVSGATTTFPISDEPGDQPFTGTLGFLFRTLYVGLSWLSDNALEKGGKAEKLWCGTLPEYQALPESDRQRPGFIAVITE